MYFWLAALFIADCSLSFCKYIAYEPKIAISPSNAVPVAFQLTINVRVNEIASFNELFINPVLPISEYIMSAASPNFCHKPYNVLPCFSCIL